jgi:dipeptidyl aminopeptidase/acylaminoacyl peptidase
MFDRYLEQQGKYNGGRGLDPHWVDDGRRFWFHARDSGDVVMLVDPTSNTAAPLLDVARVRSILRGAGVEGIPDTGLPFESLELHDADSVVRIGTVAGTFDLDLGTFRLSGAPDRPAEPQARMPPGSVRSPDSAKTVFLRDGNVWVRLLEMDREIQLTFDAEEFLRYSVSGGWARIRTPWSPDSRYLVIERSDRRELGKTPIVDWLSPEEDVSFVSRYSELQDDIPQELLYWDAATGALAAIALPAVTSGGDAVTVLGWRPASTELLVGRVLPGVRRREVLAADLVSGRVRTVLLEVGDIVPQAGAFTMLDDGFLWASDRDGHRHLYRYDYDGQLKAQLTAGDLWVVEDIDAIDVSSGWVYFRAYADPDRPYDMHFCRVRLDGTGYSVLTSQEGRHNVTLSPDMQYFLDEHSSITRPWQTDLRRVDGTYLRTLTRTDMQGLRKELRWIDAEEVVVKAADGTTDLWGALFKPYDFDPSTKYPVVIIIYTTFWPQFSPSFETGGNPRQYAQLGFITLRLALRGEYGARDRAFAAALYGRIGCCEHDDVAAALSQLAADRPWMDLDRVGVLGGSWGGYHAARFLLMRPDVFTVGIAERAWMDPRDLGSMELWMGMPEDNPEGYEQLSNLPFADRLEGRLLFVLTMADWGGTVSSTLRMVDALIRAGKPFDMLVVPGVEHLYHRSGERGEIADHYVWERQMPAYLVEHLIGTGGRAPSGATTPSRQ